MHSLVDSVLANWTGWTGTYECWAVFFPTLSSFTSVSRLGLSRSEKQIFQHKINKQFAGARPFLGQTKKPKTLNVNFNQRKIKGRSRISMVWVPPLGFDPYCEGEWLPLQNKFTPSINSKKKFLLNLWTNFEKSKNRIFLKMAQPILMTKIYVIEGTREVL